MKRSIFSALSVAAVAGAALVIAPSALAADSRTAKVQSEAFTIYQHDNYNGGWCTFTDSDKDIGNDYWTNNSGACSDGASSMINQTSHDIVMYSGEGYTGKTYFARANSSDGNLTNNGFDNQARSIEFR
ncbi:peptidase inhibitor family I36 protein [Streptomyces tubercidicus]|uniref:peptidase inhibitor family I36 protein n=1 Tax=Streptomyces tubercidicus TaxID=47759 RepID=UPI002E13B580|nr:peptidase inhibitor family I36 protein [Streptomyces tubercidicus]WSX18940.1 peptidase inhibitor family I36 protein [Streptomyces tubercidicus]